ncbi:DUF1211 domain-containing protein [Candidatus Saccharibacteria bacterium]|nr:MAG: DUF1211 domain-containing protein [Candidatus Saccharibacteria bacterium]
MKKTVKQAETYSSRRIEALTDGVFAIAMTILVLDLHVNELGPLSTSAQLWEQLYDMRTALFSIVVSFLMLGSMWAVHTRQFEYVKATDRHLTMLNTLRLLAVILMPFTTSISSAYSDLILGRILLPLNFLILTIVSMWQWQYAMRTPALHQPIAEDKLEHFKFRNHLIVVLAAIVLLLSTILGNAAFLVFLVTGFAGRSRKFAAHKS